MTHSLRTLKEIVDIKDARFSRPQGGGKDVVTVTGNILDHTGKEVPIKIETEVDNGQGIHFIQHLLGRGDFKSVDMIIKVRDG